MIKSYKERNSSFELLRIISMIMIVFHHIAMHGNFMYTPATPLLSLLWIKFITLGGKIGVNIFIFISGYFMAGKVGKLFDLRKTLKLILQICFYSIIFYLIFNFSTLRTTPPDFLFGLLKNAFPITNNLWWFSSTYFVFFLVSPFLNIFVRSINRDIHRYLLILLFVMFCIIPTVTNSSYQGNYLTWFIFLYFVAAYIRLYNPLEKLTAKHYLLISIILYGITFVAYLAITFFNIKTNSLTALTERFYYENNIFILFISLSIFMLFRKINIRNSKPINLVASLTFGVYLIHDNDFFREFMWSKIFRISAMQDSYLFILYTFGVVAAIFIACAFVDYLRSILIEKPIFKIYDKHSNKIETGLKNIFVKIKNKF